MELLDVQSVESASQRAKQADLEFVLSVLAGEEIALTQRSCEQRSCEQRARARISYRVSAVLQRVSEEDGSDCALLHVFIRDINAHGIGFISRERVRVARDALLHLPLPGGQVRHIGGWILRCREVVPGWYEGAFLFDREQPETSPEQMLAPVHGS